MEGRRVDAGLHPLHVPAVRSAALDEIVSRYLELPVRATWHGGAVDLLRGRLDDPRIELGGIATSWLPLEGVILCARRSRLTPGLPSRLHVEEPEVVALVGQRDVERWAARFQLPFELELTEQGILARARVAGLPLVEVEARLGVVGGWFVLKPRRASLLGVPNYAAWLFRTYLPLPRLAKGARLEEIGHEPGRIRLRFEVESFEEEITPGLAGRLRRRLLP
jgi:hypothetical protein